MSDTHPPLPSSGGGIKYALLGLLLIAGSCGIYLLSGDDEEEGPTEPVAALPDLGPPPARSTGYEPTIELPDELPEEPEEPEEPAPVAMQASSPMMSTTRAARPCTGSLDTRRLASVIARYRPQVRSCYERGLKANNLLQGTLNVRLKVQPNGTVSNVRVGGSLRDNDVFGCVRRVANNWRFPNPEGGCAELSQPFNLTPRN
ncbi:MAG: AgmX/PglI C-terminal domain-containing protein [Myxococcota bacterium]